MNIPRKAHVWLFFLAVYLISMILYFPVLLSGVGMSVPLNTVLVALMTFVPSIMGILFIHLTRDAQERRDFWRRVLRWPRGRTKIALAAILLMPLNVIITFWLASWWSGQSLVFNYTERVLTDWKTLLVFLVVELTFGALSEELGWRGYALDELQSRWTALASSLVLGFIWAFWHTPAFLIPGLSQYEMGGIFSPTYVFFIVSIALGSILHTWAYNNTGRSILVAGILMHFTQNAVMIFLGGIFDEFTLPPAYWPTQLAVTALIATLLVLVFGPRTFVRGMPAQEERK